MLTQDYNRMAEIIEQAQEEAKAARVELLVVIDQFAEFDADRFNYCPAEAFQTLYRLPNAAAVIGIANPDGTYQPIGEIIGRIMQASNAQSNTTTQLLKALTYLVSSTVVPNLGRLPAARTLAHQAIEFAKARGVQS